MHVYGAQDMHSLHDRLTAGLAFDLTPDVVNASDVQHHNVLAMAESMSYDLCINDYNHTVRRWEQLVREYIDPAAYDEWLVAIAAKLGRKTRGVAVMRTRDQAPKANAGASWRTWGSCMLALSFRRIPEPTIALHSRTTYLGFLAPLDMAVAYVVARRISEIIGIEVENFRFAWHIEAAQFSGFKSFRWWYRSTENFDALSIPALPPGMRQGAKMFRDLKRWDQEGVQYGDMKYGQMRRARKRYHAEIMHVPYDLALELYGNGKHAVASQNRPFPKLPRVHVDHLDFSVLDRVDSADLEEVGMTRFDTEEERA